MKTLIEVIQSVLMQNREISIRNTPENESIVVSVTGFNKNQNIKWSHSYKMEDKNKLLEGELSQIIHLLNQRIDS